MRIMLVLIACSLLVTCAKNEVLPDKGQPPDTAMWPDVRGADEPFGRICELGKACPDKDLAGHDLVCIGVTGGAAGRGFCSRPCTDVGGECFGVPNGQSASCFLEENAGDAGPGNKFCGFLCKTKTNTWTCPGGMTCGTPGGDGTAICVPTGELPKRDGGPLDKGNKDKPVVGDGIQPNSGKICTDANECAPGDTCLPLLGSTKKMCLTPCDPKYPTCVVPNPTKNASECLIKASASQYYCVWFCFYQGKTYDCPDATNFDCTPPDATQPNLKICVPK
jgi:hypothetical protein